MPTPPDFSTVLPVAHRERLEATTTYTDSVASERVTVVKHGADNTAARPTVERVRWEGTVAPDNATAGDLLVRTDQDKVYLSDGVAFAALASEGYVDDVAAGLSSTIADKRDDDEDIFLTPDLFGVSSGSPSRTAVGSSTVGQDVWSFAAGVDGRLTASVRVPTSWTGFDTTFIVTNLSTATGDVRWEFRAVAVADNDAIGGTTSLVNAPVTALGELVQQSIVRHTGFSVPAGRRVAITVSRLGSVTGDTVSGAMGLLGVVLSKSTS